MHNHRSARTPTSIEIARAGDLAAIAALLEAANLPAGDMTVAHLAHFLVLRQADGDLCGVIGLEPFGRAGLLRSLAVREGLRGDGLGRALTMRLEAHARNLGIETLYLLTTTAGGFFPSLGYRRIPRDAVPSSVAASTQFSGLCPDSATCLVKTL